MYRVGSSEVQKWREIALARPNISPKGIPPTKLPMLVGSTLTLSFFHQQPPIIKMSVQSSHHRLRFTNIPLDLLILSNWGQPVGDVLFIRQCEGKISNVIGVINGREYVQLNLKIHKLRASNLTKCKGRIGNELAPIKQRAVT